MNDAGPSNSRNFRGYLGALFATAAAVFLAVVAVNAAGDPFADFYYLTGLGFPRVRTLDTYTDVKLKSRLARDFVGLDAAIFGSSRVMRIDPAGLGQRALNLGTQGARLGQIAQFVAFATRRNPQCIPIVGLDFFAFNEGPPGSSIFLDDTRVLAGWQDAATRLASDRTLPEAWKALRGVPGSNTLLPSGLAVRKRPDPAAVRAQLERFAARDWQTWQHFRNFRYDPAKLGLLRELRARHPRAVLFVNPVSRWYFDGQTKAGLESVHAQWLADLAALGGVVDFTYAEAIVGKADRYYDMHHYDTEAGALILADVAASLRGEPLRFGRLLADTGRN